MAKPNPLSFEEVAKYVAAEYLRRGEEPARAACASFERNIALDRHKLFTRAREIAAAQTRSEST